MALKLKACKKRDPKGKFFYITDETGENSATNTTGYGGDNPTRASLAVLLFALYKPTTVEYQHVTITNNQSRPNFLVDYSNTYTNTHESTFTLEMNKDGVYEVYMYALPVVEPVDGKLLYYDPNTSSVMIKRSQWEAVTNITEVLEVEFADKYTCKELWLCYNKIVADKKLDKFTECDMSKHCKDCDKLFYDYQLQRNQMVAAYNKFQQGLPYIAQKIVERLEELNANE